MSRSSLATDSEQLTDRYNREAAPYRDLWAPILRIAGSRFVKEIPSDGVHRVLDLGTGVGSLVPDIRQHFPEARVVGVDRSAGMLALSLHDHPRAVMDATELAIPSESMDVVLAIFMLFHVSDSLAALREIARTLRPGGFAGCITWAQDLESPASRIWNECLDACGAADVDPAAVTRHDRFNSKDKITSLLEQVPFRTVRSWEEDIEAHIDMNHLLKLRTSMGSMKPRFDGLSPELQEACVTEARRRMSGLPDEGFVARGRIVNAIAQR